MSAAAWNWRWTSASALLYTLLAGIGCAVLLRRGAGKSAGMRLFLFWMAFSGIFMALPQVVIGALSEQSDIGMAMVYFGLGATSKNVAALLALVLVPLAARSLGLILLAQVGNAQQVGAAPAEVSLARPLAGVLALLFIFQLLLRPSVHFY